MQITEWCLKSNGQIFLFITQQICGRGWEINININNGCGNTSCGHYGISSHFKSTLLLLFCCFIYWSIFISDFTTQSKSSWLLFKINTSMYSTVAKKNRTINFSIDQLCTESFHSFFWPFLDWKNDVFVHTDPIYRIHGSICKKQMSECCDSVLRYWECLVNLIYLNLWITSCATTSV